MKKLKRTAELVKSIHTEINTPEQTWSHLVEWLPFATAAYQWKVPAVQAADSWITNWAVHKQARTCRANSSDKTSDQKKWGVTSKLVVSGDCPRWCMDTNNQYGSLVHNLKTLIFTPCILLQGWFVHLNCKARKLCTLLPFEFRVLL